jgi:hypothetical protein
MQKKLLIYCALLIYYLEEIKLLLSILCLPLPSDLKINFNFLNI